MTVAWIARPPGGARRRRTGRSPNRGAMMNRTRPARVATRRDTMDLTALTISEAAAALQRGETTAEAYAEALLARAAAHADLGAFIHHDPAQVRGAARAADARRKSGAPLGPLHGVPLALKDNL